MKMKPSDSHVSRRRFLSGAGGHGGSHGYLTEEFVNSILQDREPLINIAWALNMTVPGIIAHQSALKNGELLEVPSFTWPS